MGSIFLYCQGKTSPPCGLMAKEIPVLDIRRRSHALQLHGMNMEVLQALKETKVLLLLGFESNGSDTPAFPSQESFDPAPLEKFESHICLSPCQHLALHSF